VKLKLDYVEPSHKSFVTE